MKPVRLNAFVMNTVGHMAPGLWARAGDRAGRYTDLEHWADLARTLERGLFDGVFIADVIGVYDVYRGSIDSAVRRGAQIPVNDPLQIVPAMALVTEHLGFGITASVSFEHPVPFARRMSTLDHLTKGRAGWNIVTSYLESGARNLGRPAQLEHDERYDVAEEYLEVCYKLWEASWEDGAVVRDAAAGIYADPSKVHPIGHRGRHFTVPGIHLCEPSPQRTPVRYQAGASARGRAFAARHAECVFTAGPTIAVQKKSVAALREAVAAAGRNPGDVLVFNMQTVILGETDAEAERKLAALKDQIADEAALTLLSGWTGIDLSAYGPDEPLRYVKTNAGQSAVESFSVADAARQWTIRELADWCRLGGRGPVLAGSPATVADLLQEWVEETGVDGFNLTYAEMPGSFVDVADLLIPELQRRGVYKRAYAPGTLREKLFGNGPRLPVRHPAGRLHEIGAAGLGAGG